jgi:hypothetical protein
MRTFFLTNSKDFKYFGFVSDTAQREVWKDHHGSATGGFQSRMRQEPADRDSSRSGAERGGQVVAGWVCMSLQSSRGICLGNLPPS